MKGQWVKGDYVLTTRKTDLDMEKVFRFLTEESYWGRGLTMERWRRAVKFSPLCYGLYDSSFRREKGAEAGITGVAGYRQIGFARVISDMATFAYLTDVYLDREYRGKGLSLWMLTVIRSHPKPQGLRRFMLVTEDASGLYKKVGFSSLTQSEHWMEDLNMDSGRK